MSTITATIQLRRDTSANWTTNNPILLSGEIALSTDVLYTGTDQPRYKIGNGVDTWTNLDYVPEGSASYPENLYLTVVNKTGDNLLASDYKVLKVQDAQGQKLAVDYALADSNGNSVDTIGVVSENINNNQTGKIIVIGEITGLNTTGSLQGETWNDGDVLYLSSSTPGNLTITQPIAPNHLVVIGYVVYAHANQGKIYCKVQNGWELGELHDVYAPSPNNNDGIFWSSGTTRYENKSITTVLGYTPENSANRGVANGYAPLAPRAGLSLRRRVVASPTSIAFSEARALTKSSRPLVYSVQNLLTLSYWKALSTFAADPIVLVNANLPALYAFATLPRTIVGSRNIRKAASPVPEIQV